MGSTLAASAPPASSSVTPEQADSCTAPRPPTINRTTIHLLLCFVGLTRPLLYLSTRSHRRNPVSFRRGLLGSLRGSVSVSPVRRDPRSLPVQLSRFDAGPAMQQIELGRHRRRRPAAEAQVERRHDEQAEQGRGD